LIRYRAIGFVLGQFLLVLAGSMLVPVAYGVLSGTDGWWPLVASAGLTALVGGALLATTGRPDRDFSQREGLLLTVAVWLAVSLFGCLPFLLSPHFPTFTDAFFESTSGFTTTGATVLRDVEVLPRPLQFWRCFTHWLGGMGIILLGIAVLPLVGHGGMALYRAEFSGARSERLKPRLAETALALWRIYVAFTIAEFVALQIAGLDAYEALLHTFSTLGTGGFSTRNRSVGAFGSIWVEIIVAVFMLLAGMSFIQHHRMWVEGRPGRFLRDFEVRAYLLVVVLATGAIMVTLVGDAVPVGEAARAAFFQVTSILTTTGFGTADYEAWRPLAQLIVLVLMFIGGCTGSTSGGLKVARIALLARVLDREFKRMVERRGVFAVRLGGEVVPDGTIQGLLSLVYLAFVVNFAACLLLAASGVDILTSISAVASCMFNVGPGLGTVGPAENYAHLPVLAKWVLSGCMIAGRLEFFTALALLNPAFWRR
jgi:trk system potassium uptake protein TrkH